MLCNSDSNDKLIEVDMSKAFTYSFSEVTKDLIFNTFIVY